MNKVIKTTSVAAIAAAIVGVNVAPAVSAWGDNSANNQRQAYTIEQINQQVLGNNIVFNSITNSTIGDERNFVGARVDDGTNLGVGNTWNGNEITVEEGKSYLVRLYVHNNNPNGEQAVAKNVKTTFAISQDVAEKNSDGTYSAAITGYIDVDKAANVPITEYWDSVVFKSDRPFSLQYVKGSASIERNALDANGNIIPNNPGAALSDSIVTQNGVNIGDIAGCYKYASYVGIKVTPVFTYRVEKQVRIAGTKEWKDTVEAKVGDKVEYQITYQNTTKSPVENVMVKDVLPTDMKIVSDVTLYNTTNPNGIKQTGDIVKTGINIGGYAAGGGAYIRFTAEVVDNAMICGKNTLRNWGQVGVGNNTRQDSADVVVNKTCTNPTPTPTPTPTPSSDPTPTPSNNSTKTTTTTSTVSNASALPSTGPESVAAGVLGAGSIVTAAGYYIASRKQLR